VSLYHSSECGEEAERYFVETFSQRKIVTDAEELSIVCEWNQDGFVSLPAFLSGNGLAASNGKAKELISAGAVSLDGDKVTELRVPVDQLIGKVLKVGKHQFRKLV
jgi:tyrosyl-tRNA synthetase